MNVQNADSIFSYRWNLSDGYPAKGIKKNNLKVFSTFACGGGSTMGYRLAGFDVIGANDIDPQMAQVYQTNHIPNHFFLCPIKDLLTKELPEDLYSLDVLDGSPPCSTFSMTGDREKNWGKEKTFREGQAKQILDDLFFDFIDLTDKLKPKVAIAENVKGMLMGNAKGYCKMIQKRFDEIGYNVQLFLLNAATMGVPQQRERVFFICSRKDLNFPKIKLNFNFKQIPFSAISDDEDKTVNITPKYVEYWHKAKSGESVGKFLSLRKVESHLPMQTILGANRAFHFKYPRELNNTELTLAGSFPLDYNFLDYQPVYFIGMSVPPVMMAQIANEVSKQLFNL